MKKFEITFELLLDVKTRKNSISTTIDWFLQLNVCIKNKTFMEWKILKWHNALVFSSHLLRKNATILASNAIVKKLLRILIAWQYIYVY